MLNKLRYLNYPSLLSLLSLLLVLPLAAFAQDITSFFGQLRDLINTVLVPLIIAIAFLFFLFGVIQYVTAGGDEEKRTNGRNTMIYGIVALFVMVVVWGLVNLLVASFTLDKSQPDLPIIR